MDFVLRRPSGAAKPTSSAAQRPGGPAPSHHFAIKPANRSSSAPAPLRAPPIDSSHAIDLRHVDAGSPRASRPVVPSTNKAEKPPSSSSSLPVLPPPTAASNEKLSSSNSANASSLPVVSASMPKRLKPTSPKLSSASLASQASSSYQGKPPKLAPSRPPSSVANAITLNRPRLRDAHIDTTEFIPSLLNAASRSLLSPRVESLDAPLGFSDPDIAPLPLFFPSNLAYVQTFHKLVVEETVASLCEDGLRAIAAASVKLEAAQGKPVKLVIDTGMSWPQIPESAHLDKTVLGFSQAHRRFRSSNSSASAGPGARALEENDLTPDTVLVASATPLKRFSPTSPQSSSAPTPFYLLRESLDGGSHQVFWQSASPIFLCVISKAARPVHQSPSAAVEVFAEDGNRMFAVAWPQCFLYLANSIVSNHREFDAVSAVQRSSMMPHILYRSPASTLQASRAGAAAAAEDGDPFKPVVASPRVTASSDWKRLDLKGITRAYQFMFAEQFNESQLNAIAAAAELKSGFCLVQGPPGTGKTMTLLGILNTLHLNVQQECYEQDLPDPFARERASLPPDDFLSDRGNPHLLVVAPSNKAIDHVAAQIRLHGFLDGQGNRYTPVCTRLSSDRWATEQGDDLNTLSLEYKVRELMALNQADVSKEAEQLALRLKGLIREVDHLKKRVVDLAYEHALHPSAEKNFVFHQTAGELVHARNRAKECAMHAERVNLLRGAISKGELRKRLRALELMRSHLIFTTLSQCGSATITDIAPKVISFRVVVVDEAAQAVEPSALIPLSLGCQRCVLVGDPMQLPATVKSSQCKQARYETSLFERLQRAGHAAHLLQTQYRCRQEISGFVSANFYNGVLNNGAKVLDPTYSLTMYGHPSKAYGPFVFWNVAWSETLAENTSFINRQEADVCLRALQVIRQWNVVSPVTSQPVSVAVISPYKEQVNLLRSMFRSAGFPTGSRSESQPSLQIDTIDAFQGNEVDVVIFSCVRAEETSGVGFLDDARRLNVALTRARFSLLVVGDVKVLRQKSRLWRSLIEYVRSKGAIVDIASLRQVPS